MTVGTKERSRDSGKKIYKPERNCPEGQVSPGAGEGGQLPKDNKHRAAKRRIGPFTVLAWGREKLVEARKAGHSASGFVRMSWQEFLQSNFRSNSPAPSPPAAGHWRRPTIQRPFPQAEAFASGDVLFFHPPACLAPSFHGSSEQVSESKPHRFTLFFKLH